MQTRRAGVHNYLCACVNLFEGVRKTADLGLCVMAVPFFFIVLLGLVSLIVAQAPGDSDNYCLMEFVGGVPNPFFNNRIYAANARALMDSKDYIGLLQGQDPEDLPWQSVDNDDNNDDEFVTAVSQSYVLYMKCVELQLAILYIFYICSGVSHCFKHVMDQCQCVDFLLGLKRTGSLLSTLVECYQEDRG